MTLKSCLPQLVMVASLGLSLGCEPGGIGDPCTPEDEYQLDFPGFAVNEVNVESRSFQCETRICLVNHFQGRVSCPFGQTEAEVDAALGRDRDPMTGELRVDGNGDIIETDPDDRSMPLTPCRIPTTDEPVKTEVKPQLQERRASRAAYCSCRCDGPDSNARYCECPSGYSCEKLVDELGIEGGGQLAGSYCIKEGTQYDSAATKTPCSDAANNCDD